jgi:HK97 gp10 family phage protein
MPFGLRGKLEGLGDVFAALDGLGRTIRNKILRASLVAATTPMLKAAQQRVRKSSGLLRKSLGRKVKTYRRNGTVAVMIGPRRGHGKPVILKEEEIFRQFGGRTIKIRNPRVRAMRITRNPVRYAHLIEKGTKTRAARPFLAPAFSSTKAQAENIFRARVASELLKFASGGARRRAA